MSLLADTLRVEHHTWETRLNPDRAAAKLQGVGLSRGRAIAKAAPDAPLIGRSGPPFVTARRRMPMPNAWQPVFRGRFTEHGKGSRLTATIRPAAWTYGIYGAWIALTTVGAIVGAISAVGEGSPLALIFPLFPVLAVAMTLFSGHRCRGDRELICTTISSAINGTEITP